MYRYPTKNMGTDRFDIEKPIDKYINIKNLKLHYLEWGTRKSPIMILLHGVGDNAHVWDYFCFYSSNFLKIIALDQRGHGDSDWAIPPAYSCNDYVNDIEMLIEVLRLKKIILMGHSMGGLHAIKYASLIPNKVSALIHIDIEPCPPSWNRKYVNGLFSTLPLFYDSIQSYLSHVHRYSRYASQEMLLHLASHALQKKEDGKLYLKFDRECLRHFEQYDLRPHLSDIKCPTLIIRGEESRVMRREIAKEMKRSISNCRLIEIPKATHPVHTDNPTKFREAVLEFLNDCGQFNNLV